MVVVMHEGATEDQVQNVIDRLIQIGFDVHRSTGTSHTVLGAVGGAQVDPRDVELLDGVREVVKISASYKLASRAFKPDGTIVNGRTMYGRESGTDIHDCRNYEGMRRSGPARRRV